jgi:endonuclease/exonuclease/phosphatase family metal-dependent hydrolase
MEAGSRLKILSCNIRRNVPEDQVAGNGWDARRDLCAEVITKQNADVICLQESVNPQWKDLSNRLPGFSSFGLANPDQVFNPTNAILFARTRFEMVSAGGFWLSETPHVAGSKSWDSAHPRFVNWVHLRERESGKEFRVWNAHLDHIGQVARERQAQLIMEASEVFPDLPQLLTGDFNADAANPAIEIVKAGGWLDTYTAVHGPEDPGFTFHAFLGPRFAEERPNARVKGKMDFIFARGAVKTVAAEIIRDGRDGRYPSDHYFISAEVTLG